jgi:hypothetical protein
VLLVQKCSANYSAFLRLIVAFIHETSAGSVRRRTSGSRRLQFAEILATEFGGGSEAKMDSAYGGKVDPDQPQAALPACLPDDPSRRRIRVLNPRNGLIVVCLD